MYKYALLSLLCLMVNAAIFAQGPRRYGVAVKKEVRCSGNPKRPVPSATNPNTLRQSELLAIMWKQLIAELRQR